MVNCRLRALKTRGNTPKYGLIFHSTFIGRAGTKNKGRISRYLANKCSIASRIDSFTGNVCMCVCAVIVDKARIRFTGYVILLVLCLYLLATFSRLRVLKFL